MVNSCTSTNLLDALWLDRPLPISGKIWRLPTKISGKTVSKKLEELSEPCRVTAVKQFYNGSSVNWLVNMRGTFAVPNKIVFAF